ncbi:pyridoxine/pyridoxamine 5'-phosphate oxidase [Pseudomonas zhanjiangensis]|uniref:Pyridoxal 5'-phosphate synthase n=1 Tax=Pseudomonas zhanjiangensis TaxID=3239015 RepID=A0ABV3YZX6_9PSED
MTNQEASYQQAVERLQLLIDTATSQGVQEPHAAALATADRYAHPSVRMVYVVAVEEAGLLFFVNMESGKGQQLLDNPRAALCFFWRELQEQVTLEGDIQMQSIEVADEYWRKRSRAAQLAAWAFPQGAAAPDKAELRQQVRQLEQTLGFEAVPRSPNWCALRLLPERIEFWPSGWQRVRERTRYLKGEDGHWTVEALTP